MNEIPDNGLRLWLKPQGIADAGIEGQRVMTWIDATRHQNHAIAPSMQRAPIFRRKRNQSKWSSLYFGKFFDGEFWQSHRMEIHGMQGRYLTDKQEVFAILRPDTITPTGGAGAMWDFGGEGPDEPGSFPHPDGDIRESLRRNDIVTGISAANVTAGWNLYNVSTEPGNMTVRVNTVEVYNADPGSTITFGTFAPSLGVYEEDRYFEGAFAEVIAYSHVLSAGQRDEVIQYLSDKYALGFVPVIPPEPWNPNWSDAEVRRRRQNYGYFTAVDANGVDTGMADVTDHRSFQPGRLF